MPKQQKGNKGGNRKIGRYKAKCEQYSRRQQKEKNALKHMLKSNCYKDAVEYAKKHGLKIPQPPVRRKSWKNTPTVAEYMERLEYEQA